VSELLPGGFSRNTVAWLVGAAAASFLAALLFAAFGDLLDRPTAGPNTFSYSALGHRALADFLRREGLGVASRQSRGGDGPGPDRPLVVDEPEVGRKGWIGRIAGLVQEARERKAPLVVVLPKWRGKPRKDRSDWLASATLLGGGKVQEALAAFDVPELRSASVERTTTGEGLLRCRSPEAPDAGTDGPEPFAGEIDVRPAQLLASGSGLTAVVACGGEVLIGRGRLKPDGPPVFVVSDPDLWNNRGLARAGHAALARYLFVDLLAAQGVVFDETIHGFEQDRGLLAEAFRFPLLPGVLQGFLLLGVVLWAGMGRFAPPLPEAPAVAPGKEALIENTAQLLDRGGQAADSLSRYYQQTLRAVGARFFLPPDLPDRELATRLTELGKGRQAPLDLAALEHRIASLVNDSAARREGRGRRATEARAAVLARRLHRWRREMTNGE
jgi:hypothetical protein